MSRNFNELKRLGQSLSDAARIGSRELKRGVNIAKQQIERVQFVHKRKELFAELGRALYEANHDGLPEPVAQFLKETEFQEIIQEIELLDKELEVRQRHS